MQRLLEGGNLKFPLTMRGRRVFQLHLFSRDEILLSDGERGDFVSLYDKLHFIRLPALSFSPTRSISSRLISVRADHLSEKNIFRKSSLRKIF